MQGNASATARAAWVAVAALAIFVLWVLTDVSANAGIGFFYVVPVGMAAWWGGRRWAIAAVAAGSCLFLLGAAVQPVAHLPVAFALRLIAFSGCALVVTALRERLLVLEHSAEELEAIRAALTPATLPEIAGVDAGAAFVPSELGVSGDFYLLTNGPDGSTVAIVGDVVGHGPKAARLATFIRARFAAFAANSSDPAELLALANGALVDRPGRKRDLVSAACLRFRPEDSQLCWALAGHPPPLRLPDFEELESRGTSLPLGGQERLDLSTAEAYLKGAGGVVVYTDGATDVRRGNSLLGLEGLARLMRPISHLPSREMVTRLEEAILGWAEPPVRDDLCVVVLKPR